MESSLKKNKIRFSFGLVFVLFLIAAFYYVIKGPYWDSALLYVGYALVLTLPMMYPESFFKSASTSGKAAPLPLKKKMLGILGLVFIAFGFFLPHQPGRALNIGSDKSDAWRFGNVSSMATDSTGNLYIAFPMQGSNGLIKVAPDRAVTLLDKSVGEELLSAKNFLAADNSGNVFVTDDADVIKIAPNGVVTKLAKRTSQWDGDWTAIATDGAGNVYLSNDDTIRKIVPGGTMMILAGSRRQGVVMVTGPSTRDGIGSQARFHRPTGLATDDTGNVFVADAEDKIIRKVTRRGVVTTLAGKTEKDGYQDGPASEALFHAPERIAVDSAGNIYVTDGQRIRKITPGGMVTTFAGNSEDERRDGVLVEARFGYLTSIAIDKAGNMYLGDAGSSMKHVGPIIRKISPNGVVSTPWSLKELAEAAGCKEMHRC